MIRVWWPWLQATQRASGNYGKRRVCQGQCLLYSKRLLWNPFCCQLTFSLWENAFYQSLLTLGGCRPTQNLGTKQSQGKSHDLVLLLEEKDGSCSHPGSPTCHQIVFRLPPWKDKLAPVLKVLVAWSGQFHTVPKCWKTKASIGREADPKWIRTPDGCILKYPCHSVTFVN